MTTNTGAAISTTDIKRARTKPGTDKSVATTPVAPRPVRKPSKAANPPSKASAVIKMLCRPKGATGTEITSATDWQAHSVRAYLSGLRKKGHTLVREPRKDGEQSYRQTKVAAPTDQLPASATKDCQADGSDEAPVECEGLECDSIDVRSPGAAPAAAA